MIAAGPRCRRAASSVGHAAGARDGPNSGLSRGRLLRLWTPEVPGTVDRIVVVSSGVEIATAAEAWQHGCPGHRDKGGSGSRKAGDKHQRSQSCADAITPWLRKP